MTLPAQPDRPRPIDPELRSASDPAAVPLLEDILHSGAALRVRVTGRSMKPAVHAGDIVSVVGINPSELSIGDLILVKRQNGKPLLHRLLKKRKVTDGLVFIVMGDATSGPDEPIPAARVLGRAFQLERTGQGDDLKTIDLLSPSRRFSGRLLAFAYRARLALGRLKRAILRRRALNTTGREAS